MLIFSWQLLSQLYCKKILLGTLKSWCFTNLLPEMLSFSECSHFLKYLSKNVFSPKSKRSFLVLWQMQLLNVLLIWGMCLCKTNLVEKSKPSLNSVLPLILWILDFKGVLCFQCPIFDEISWSEMLERSHITWKRVTTLKLIITDACYPIWSSKRCFAKNSWHKFLFVEI